MEGSVGYQIVTPLQHGTAASCSSTAAGCRRRATGRNGPRPGRRHGHRRPGHSARPAFALAAAQQSTGAERLVLERSAGHGRACRASRPEFLEAGPAPDPGVSRSAGRPRSTCPTIICSTPRTTVRPRRRRSRDEPARRGGAAPRARRLVGALSGRYPPAVAESAQRSVIVSAVRRPSRASAVPSPAIPRRSSARSRFAPRSSASASSRTSRSTPWSAGAAGRRRPAAPARQAAVGAGLPISPARRSKGRSSIRAVEIADSMTRAGDVDIVVTGGMESMSEHAVRACPEGALRLSPRRRCPDRLMIHDALTSTFDGAPHGRAGLVGRP